MKSMTGFGRAIERKPLLFLEITIKSVNNRYLETRFRLPKEYISFEMELKKIVPKYFERGSLDIYVTRMSGSQGFYDIEVNSSLAKKWLKAYQILGHQLNIQQNISLAQAATWPDVITQKECTISLKEKQTLFHLFKIALKNCDNERLREGKALYRELLKLIQELQKKTSQMFVLKKSANQLLLERLKARLKQLNEINHLDEQRLSHEVILEVDRTDVTEELSRLNEHLKVFRQVINQSEACGKKLDFYCQELLRELNTIGSKSLLSRMTQLVVDGKTITEKLREQVQNIE